MLHYHKLENEIKDLNTCVNQHSGDKTIIYKSFQGTKLYLSLYYPENFDRTSHYPIFVFIHGGGWNSSKTFQDQESWQGDYLGYLARYYTQKGYISASIDYRMIQQCGQKDGFGLIDLYQDCFDAVRYLKDNSKKLCLDFERATVLGESAGGYLAAALTTFPYNDCTIFKKAILVNPITDLFDTIWNTRVPDNSYYPLFKGKSRDEITKMLSPALNISLDTPKTLLLHGMSDSVVYPSQSLKYHDEMVIHGRDVQLHLIEDTGHAFLLAEYQLEKNSSLKATSIAIEIIDQWLAQ